MRCSFTIFFSGLAVLATVVDTGRAQSRAYPDKIRGYKVERTVIEIKVPAGKTGANSNGAPSTANDPVDNLITFGKPSLARVTPLGITFEVPIVVAPVTQSGKVEFLVFEDIQVNGQSVRITDYNHAFHLPNSGPLTLKDPLSINVYLPTALMAAIDEWTNSKDAWPVTGRIYVFGKFRKGLFTFKRCVPVEVNLTMRNPLKEK